MDNDKIVYWDHFNEHYSHNIERCCVEGKHLLPLLYDYLDRNKNGMGTKLCDVGCACGALYHILKDKYVELEYYGFDLSKINLVTAKERAPEIEFGYLDATIDDLKRSYDVVFSGEMLPHISLEHIPIAIKKLVNNARKYCLFSLKCTDLEAFEHDHVNEGHEVLYSFPNYEEVTEYMRSIVDSTTTIKFHKRIYNIKFLPVKYIDKISNLRVEVIK